MELRGGGGRNARREPKANRTERRTRDDALDPFSLPAPVVLRACTVSRLARRGGARHFDSIPLFFSLNIFPGQVTQSAATSAALSKRISLS
jgi:hypothetical protein